MIETKEREEKIHKTAVTYLGHIICVGWLPIGNTVVTIWVVVVCCGTNGLDGGTPPTAENGDTKSLMKNWKMKMQCHSVGYLPWA